MIRLLHRCLIYIYLKIKFKKIVKIFFTTNVDGMTNLFMIYLLVQKLIMHCNHKGFSSVSFIF